MGTAAFVNQWGFLFASRLRPNECRLQVLLVVSLASSDAVDEEGRVGCFPSAVPAGPVSPLSLRLMKKSITVDRNQSSFNAINGTAADGIIHRPR